MSQGTEERARPVVVGVLSDTHGLLHPQVMRLLQGVDHIVHAGDIGMAQVLNELKAIAPVTAVRGNCDLEAWARSLPVVARPELGGARILVGHNAGRLPLIAGGPGRRDAGRHEGSSTRDDGEGFGVVITGHTHMAAAERRGGTLYLNPGSAGPRRFGRPRTMARLTIHPPGGAEGSQARGSEAGDTGRGAEVSYEILKVEATG